MKPTMMFSINGSEFFAPVGVELRRAKEQREDGDENQVRHNLYLSTEDLAAFTA